MSLARALVMLAALALLAAAPPRRSVTIDDVLRQERIDSARLSPDGRQVAVAIQRAAVPGEVYGRTAYEVDPSRDDVWLIETASGARRRLTDGAATAAGSWCPTWSPNGRRLAMLSTSPKDGEPRGGDNVRLYVWDGVVVRRVGNEALMTQTRYGSGVDKLDLRGGADNAMTTHTCRAGEENTPFLWLDDNHLLVVTLPATETSALIDQYTRPFRDAATTASRLRHGDVPTVITTESGTARSAATTPVSQAVLRVLDVRNGAGWTVAHVPRYSFRSALSIAVAPGNKRLAVLATRGAVAPVGKRRLPRTWDEDWTVEKALALLDLVPNAAMRWIKLPATARFPVALAGWSPRGRHLALWSRSNPFDTTAKPLLIQSGGSIFTTFDDTVATAAGFDDAAAIWADEDRLLIRTGPEGWQLLTPSGAATKLPLSSGSFERTSTGDVIGVVEDVLVRLAPTGAALKPIRPVPAGTTILSPTDSIHATSRILLGIPGGYVRLFTPATDQIGPLCQLPLDDLLDARLDVGIALWGEASKAGLTLHATDLQHGTTRALLKLNAFMLSLDWGGELLIKPEGGGEPLGAAILPPGYDPHRRYPTLVWIYPGYRVRGLAGDYWMNPLLPGIFNLRLYAAHGYVVLIPSLPLPPPPERRPIGPNLAARLQPAIDRLTAMGIADPDRLGVFGQSLGGYGVYTLVTQTNRFKAAVAMAGITDVAAFAGEFDPTTRNYQGIAHEKSDNWAEVDQFGMQVPFWRDPAGYAADSPITAVARVHTPLLMIHGDLDVRGSVAEAERFFLALYDQGKPARLLRYQGESHSLAQSPANIRDIVNQTLRWFDTYLKPSANTSSGFLSHHE